MAGNTQGYRDMVGKWIDDTHWVESDSDEEPEMAQEGVSLKKRPLPTALERLRDILQQARNSCPVLRGNDVDDAAQIRRSLDDTGVAVVLIGNVDVGTIQRQVGTLVVQTFPRLSDDSRIALAAGDFSPASREWDRKKVTETGMALKSYRMPQPVPLVASRQPIFTDNVLRTTHLYNPLLAMAPLTVWETIARANPRLHPAQWFAEGQGRMICSEDGIKFASKVSYGPTKIHYDGQPNRVQIIFTTDTVDSVRLYAVPGSGLPEAQTLIAEILGVPLMGGFSTHTAAMDRHPELRDLMHEFGVTVPGNGLLAFKTRVWHFEHDGVVPFDYDRVAKATKMSTVFRVYCGVMAIDTRQPRSTVEMLIRHAYFREHHWPMEPFTYTNRHSPLFVAEKTSQAAERGDYAQLQPDWSRIATHTLDDMRQFLRRVPLPRLELHGLHMEDLF